MYWALLNYIGQFLVSDYMYDMKTLTLLKLTASLRMTQNY